MNVKCEWGISHECLEQANTQHSQEDVEGEALHPTTNANFRGNISLCCRAFLFILGEVFTCDAAAFVHGTRQVGCKNNKG